MGDTFKTEMILKEAAEELAEAIGATVSIHIGNMEWWAVTPPRPVDTLTFDPFRGSHVKVMYEISHALDQGKIQAADLDMLIKMRSLTFTERDQNGKGKEKKGKGSYRRKPHRPRGKKRPPADD